MDNSTEYDLIRRIGFLQGQLHTLKDATTALGAQPADADPKVLLDYLVGHLTDAAQEASSELVLLLSEFERVTGGRTDR